MSDPQNVTAQGAHGCADDLCAPSDQALYQILRTHPRKRSPRNALTSTNAGAQGAPPTGCREAAHPRGLASLRTAIAEWIEDHR